MSVRFFASLFALVVSVESAAACITDSSFYPFVGLPTDEYREQKLRVLSEAVGLAPLAAVASIEHDVEVRLWGYGAFRATRNAGKWKLQEIRTTQKGSTACMRLVNRRLAKDWGQAWSALESLLRDPEFPDSPPRNQILFAVLSGYVLEVRLGSDYRRLYYAGPSEEVDSPVDERFVDVLRMLHAATGYHGAP